MITTAGETLLNASAADIALSELSVNDCGTYVTFLLAADVPKTPLFII